MVRAAMPFLNLAAGVSGAGALITAPIVDPCKNIPCPPLTCPGGSLMKSYDGHCCPYCESQVVIKDDRYYGEEAKNAYATYRTAKWAGGSASAPVGAEPPTEAP